MRRSSNILTEFLKAQDDLVIQSADLPLGTLAEMVGSGAIDLEPGFQRRERWKIEKQSALIESFLLNVPVPPIYLSEQNDGTYTAIDGKQRLKSISDYILGKFALKDLEKLESARGLKFLDLPSEIQNSLKLRPYLRVVTLLRQSDPLLKYEVFLRLNRGGESLNPQEIRNVAFRGRLNNLIYKLSENKFLRRQLKIKNFTESAYRQMSDAEYVLRFLTLRSYWSDFSGSLSREMDRFMEQNRNCDDEFITRCEKDFESAIGRCEQLWGGAAFRRPDGENWRDQTLAGMYDAQMIACSEITEDQFKRAIRKKESITQKTRSLFDDGEFDQAVRTGTNTPSRIQLRVERMMGMLAEV
ncbi:MAG: DUF262 domain-containing protein [Pseudomonadota bacterium]|nr:DUF262 domain-containing protein [Pseudomonadota bacterium]